MRKHTERIDFKNKVSNISGLPLDVLGRQPVFQMCSDREIIIEGAENLEYYDECTTRIRTCRNITTVNGKNLSIKCLANKNIAVCGVIDRIELERF